jgi:hypothetical protein
VAIDLAQNWCKDLPLIPQEARNEWGTEYSCSWAGTKGVPDTRGPTPYFVSTSQLKLMLAIRAFSLASAACFCCSRSAICLRVACS